MTTERSGRPDPGPARHRGWRIFGGVATAAVMLPALVLAGDAIWTTFTPERVETDSRVYTAPVPDVRIDVDIGYVDLGAGTGPDLDVRRETTWQGARPEVDERSRAGGGFEARADCDSGRWLPDRPDTCAVGYKLAVPSGTAAEVRTGIGGVTATGLDGAVDLGTGMGDVDARNLRSTRTAVETGIGDIRVGFTEVLGDVELTATLGTIIVTVPDDATAYHVEAVSGAGDRHIAIDTVPAAEADRTITVATSMGDVRIQYAR